MLKKIHIIFNPVAGAGKASKVKSWLMAVLKARFGDGYEWAETRYVGDAVQLAQKSILNGAELIIIVGGDGTINEVVNGLFNENHQNPSCELGILNCGSGGGFAQSLGLPTKISEQLDVACQGISKPIDVGEVIFSDIQGRVCQRYFVNECQVGISAVVVSKVGTKHKRFGGTIAFGSAAISALIRSEAVQMKTSLDGYPSESGKLLGVTIANGRYCAGGMQLTPGASPSDGLFDVLHIREMNLWQRFLSFGKVYSGKHIFLKNFLLHQSKEIEIVAEPPVGVEADGELLGVTPCRIRVIPAAINVRF
ncbi:MAG: diacylglycerol kinase family lipid kinase [Saprospiraceae bacterium]|nr:diacylglycerol kinase family lipid kinase [Saprospiraceae bacterium]